MIVNDVFLCLLWTCFENSGSPWFWVLSFRGCEYLLIIVVGLQWAKCFLLALLILAMKSEKNLICLNHQQVE